MKFSTRFSLSWMEAGKAMILTAIGAISMTVYNSWEDGKFPTIETWHHALSDGAKAAFFYLAMKFFMQEPKQVEIDPEQTKIINTTTKEVIPTVVAQVEGPREVAVTTDATTTASINTSSPVAQFPTD